MREMGRDREPSPFSAKWAKDWAAESPRVACASPHRRTLFGRSTAAEEKHRKTTAGLQFLPRGESGMCSVLVLPRIFDRASDVDGSCFGLSRFNGRHRRSSRGSVMMMMVVSPPLEFTASAAPYTPPQRLLPNQASPVKLLVRK
jgi:hypothetical protein